MSKDLGTVSVFTYPDGRMNTSSAAQYLGLSEKTLAHMRSAGKGPRFIKRGRIFYYKADVDAWLEAGRANSTAEARLRTSQRSCEASATARREAA
jgi:predicted DNA-binding transcriptional regulator AlpA